MRLGFTLPLNHLTAKSLKAMVIILSGRPHEGLSKLNEISAELEQRGVRTNPYGAPKGIALAMMGQLDEGIKVIKEDITRQNSVGFTASATWGRLILAKLYIQVLRTSQRPTLRMLVKNFRGI